MFLDLCLLLKLHVCAPFQPHSPLPVDAASTAAVCAAAEAIGNVVLPDAAMKGDIAVQDRAGDMQLVCAEPPVMSDTDTEVQPAAFQQESSGSSSKEAAAERVFMYLQVLTFMQAILCAPVS